jgi:hypothetical protein
MDTGVLTPLFERYGFILAFFAVLFACTYLLEKAERVFLTKVDGMDVVLRRRWVRLRLIGATATAVACLAITLYRA